MPDTVELTAPELAGLRLDLICSGGRFHALDNLDAYAKCRQYERLRYNWDGNLQGYAGEADIAPGWYVPLKLRKPDTRFDLGKLIISRLTAMALGEERWPELRFEDDPDAEDYCKALARESQLQSRIQEARNKGGACGTAVVSFAFVKGKPRVKVHEAKHIFVFRWEDRDELTIGACLKVYPYRRTVWEAGKPKEKTFYSARFWDTQKETVWDPIPEELARNGSWATSVKSYTVVHGYGECPVYWTQNLPDSENEDGQSDIQGLTDTFDVVNRLLSATSKGTIANVDPTLVIKDNPVNNKGAIRKGSDNAIWSPGGAEYLELQGNAVKTAKELADALVKLCLDTAGVVLGDPQKMSGSAQSAAALKMLYMPMVNQCDLLRTQYGRLITAVLLGMLRAARLVGSLPPGPVQTTADGTLVQSKPTILLPPRLERPEQKDTDPARPVREQDKPGEPKMVERVPGESEDLTLHWPPYFPPTLTDIGAAVDAASKAKGTTISQRTAVKFTAPLFGVEDVDREIAEIDVERERNALMYPGPDGTFGGTGEQFGAKGGDNEGEPDE